MVFGELVWSGKNGRTLSVFSGKGGWWARLEKPGYMMDHGPYPFRWMAKQAFPIQRWTW
jgi:hypothetical protein